MKLTLLITLFAASLMAQAQIVVGDKQLPEPGKIYEPGTDSGFDQYKTQSLFHTKKVVLTFDDGPDTVNTPKLLEILKKNNVKATFFMLSERINDKTIPLVKNILADGHIIASHHHDHENNNGKNEAAYRDGLKDSILKIETILEETKTPHRQIYYRFPYGAYGSRSLNYHHFNVMKEVSKELFGDNCINFVFWDIDSLDWLKPMDQSDVISNVLANIEGGTAYNMKRGRISGKAKKDKYTIKHPMGGGVVLMHDIHARSVSAVEPLLKSFKDKGIEVVSLDDVEEYKPQAAECKLKK